MVLVSHDFRLIDQVAKEIWCVADFLARGRAGGRGQGQGRGRQGMCGGC